MAAFFGFRKAPSNSISEEKKPPFLERGALAIYPTVAGKLQKLTRLPPRTDIHEWLATNSLGFFNHINVQFGTVSEMCTQTTCPAMTAGKESFDWLDDRKGSKKTRLPAKQFIDTSLAQIQRQLRNEQIFPTKFGFEFPVEFVPTVRKIFRTYFAILAHIYYHHFQEVLRLALHDGLNTLFLHFMYFVQEFSLLEPKEYSCMEEFVAKLMQLDQDWAKRPLSDDYSGSLATNADERHS